MPPPLPTHTYGVATAALPWSDRARRALQPMTEGEPDALVLAALLADEQGPARRLLEQAGLDTGAVLATARTVAGSGGPHSVAGDDSRAWTSAHTSTVAVPRIDLWRVVRDPRRRVEWDDTVARVQVLDDRSFRTLDALSGTLAGPGRPVEDPGLMSTHVVTETEEGRLIEWEARFPSRGHTEWLRVEIEDDGAGSRLTLRHAFSRPQGTFRLFSRLYAWTTHKRLKVLSQAIAQAAAV